MGTGTLHRFSDNSAMSVMIQSLIYLGGSTSARGRRFHFEGRDPRNEMPASLKRWVIVCQISAILFMIIVVTDTGFDLVTVRMSLRELLLWN